MMVAFAVLAGTEPTIAANQLAAAQALHLADAGLQLAMWALTNSTDPNNLGMNLTNLLHDGTPAGGSYDGNHYVTLGGTGGFTMLVTWAPGNGTYERTVTTVGWTPLKDAGFLNTHRKIQAVVQIPEVIRYATSHLIRGQAIGAVIGAAIGLTLGIFAHAPARQRQLA